MTDKVSAVIVRASKLTSLLQSVNGDFDDKYPDLCSLVEQSSLLRNKVMTNQQFSHSFLKEIHNVLDIYYFCGSSCYETLDTLGLRSVGMFVKALVFSQRKMLLCVLKAISSQYDLPRIMSEERFRVCSEDVYADLKQSAKHSLFNLHEFRMQQGVISRDILHLIHEDFRDSPEVVPANVKISLGQVFDEESNSYKDDREMLDDLLQRKGRFLRLEASLCKDTVAETIANIQSSTQALIQEQKRDAAALKRDTTMLKATEISPEQIISEFMSEIKGNIEERTRTRMRAVLAQITSQMMRKTQNCEAIVQTDGTFDDLQNNADRLDYTVGYLTTKLESTNAKVVELQGKINTMAKYISDCKQESDLIKAENVQLKVDGARLQAENAVLDAEVAVRQFASDPVAKKSPLEVVLRNLEEVSKKILKLVSTSSSVGTQFLGQELGSSSVFSQEKRSRSRSKDTPLTSAVENRDKFMKFLKNSRKGEYGMSSLQKKSGLSEKYLTSQQQQQQQLQLTSTWNQESSPSNPNTPKKNQNAEELTEQEQDEDDEDGVVLLELFNQLESQEDREFVVIFLRNLIDRQQGGEISDEKSSVFISQGQTLSSGMISEQLQQQQANDIRSQQLSKRHSILELAFTNAIRDAGLIISVPQYQMNRSTKKSSQRKLSGCDDEVLAIREKQFDKNHSGQVLPLIHNVVKRESEVPLRTRQRKSVSLTNLKSLGGALLVANSLPRLQRVETKMRSVVVSEFSPWEENESEDPASQHVQLTSSLRKKKKVRVLTVNSQRLMTESIQSMQQSIEESLPYILNPSGGIELRKPTMAGSIGNNINNNSNGNILLKKKLQSIGSMISLAAQVNRGKGVSSKKLSSLEQQNQQYQQVHELNEHTISAIYLHVAQNHSQMAECVAVLSNEGVGKSELDKLTKQVKYPFKNVNEIVSHGVDHTNMHSSNLDFFAGILKSLSHAGIRIVLKYYSWLFSNLDSSTNNNTSR